MFSILTCSFYFIDGCPKNKPLLPCFSKSPPSLQFIRSKSNHPNCALMGWGYNGSIREVNWGGGPRIQQSFASFQGASLKSRVSKNFSQCSVLHSQNTSFTIEIPLFFGGENVVRICCFWN